MTTLAKRLDSLEGKTDDGTPVVVALVDDDDLQAGNVMVITEHVVTEAQHAST